MPLTWVTTSILVTFVGYQNLLPLKNEGKRVREYWSFMSLWKKWMCELHTHCWVIVIYFSDYYFLVMRDEFGFEYCPLYYKIH